MGQGKVRDAISEVYSGLRYIAIIIYIISLLLLGLKTLAAVGTPQESKTKKFVQYWITGAVILIFVPMFLPVIPYISNKLTESLSAYSDAAGEFSVTYIATYLGEKYLGEDADVKEARAAIEKRLQTLYDLAYKKQADDFTPMSPEEVSAALQGILSDIESSSAYPNDKFEVKHNASQISKEIITYINQHCTDWKTSDDAYIQQKINAMWDAVYGKEGLSQLSSDYSKDIKDAYSQDPSKSGSAYLIQAFGKTVMSSILNSQGSSNYKGSYFFIQAMMTIGKAGLSTLPFENKMKEFQAICVERNKIADDARAAMQAFVEQYKESAVVYEIETLQKMQSSLTDDPMVSLKELAKSEHRVVYAIAWCIMLFQLFALLFMYYRRLFVVIILICVFPLVVAMYVIDKMGDGHAQSLQNWFKEFFANCVIQFFHATIYVLIINIGISICREDPTKNWLYLIICISFLFPAEKILRGMVGLQASTIEGLKMNIVGGLLAAKSLGKAAGSVGKVAANATKGGFNAAQLVHQNARLNGLTGIKGHAQAASALAHVQLREALAEEEKKRKEEKEKKKKKAQDKHDSRSQRKDLQRQAQKNAQQLDKGSRTAKDRLLAAQGNVHDAVNTAKDKASSAAHTAADKLKNSKAGQAVGSAARKVGSTAGNLADKAKNSKAANAARKFGNKAGELAHKAANTKAGRMGLSAAKFAGQAGKYAGTKMWNNRKDIAKGLAKGYGKLATAAAIGAKAMDSMGTSGIGTAMGDAALLSGALKGNKPNEAGEQQATDNGYSASGTENASGKRFADYVNEGLHNDSSGGGGDNSSSSSETSYESGGSSGSSQSYDVDGSSDSGSGLDNFDINTDVDGGSGSGSGGSTFESRTEVTFDNTELNVSGTLPPDDKDSIKDDED